MTQTSSKKSLLVKRIRVGFLGVLSFGLMTFVATPASTATSEGSTEPISISIIGLHDFEGVIDDTTVAMAGTVEELREKSGDDATLFISTGDNTAASGTRASLAQRDKPTIDVLNALELDVTAVGNHEFDGGANKLKNELMPRSNFAYVASNVTQKNKPIFSPYSIVEVKGLRIAIVGATTRSSTILNLGLALDGFKFSKPSDAVNATVASLKDSKASPDLILAAYHEGAKLKNPGGLFANLYSGIVSGDSLGLTYDTDPTVAAIFAGHVLDHYVFDGPVPGSRTKTRPVVQGEAKGASLSYVTLKLDPITYEVIAYTAIEVPRTTTPTATLLSKYPRVKEVNRIVEEAQAFVG